MDVITFGKYKGKTLTELIDLDLSYVGWCFEKNVKHLSPYQRTTLENLYADAMRKLNSRVSEAYYNTPVFRELMDEVRQYMIRTYTIIEDDARSIVKDDDICDMINWSGGSNTILFNGKTMLYPQLEAFDSKFLALRQLYGAQYKIDETETRPSRKVCPKWVYLPGYSNYSSTANSGKWMVFLDKIKHDAEGKTEIDRCWNLIVEHADFLMQQKYTAKVSTGRPNPNSNSPTSGVIILYCPFEERLNLMQRFRSIFDYDRPTYWKSDGSASHATSESEEGK